MICLCLTTAAAFGLAGCKDEKKAQPSADAAMQRIRDAAEQNIQSKATAPATIRFRGVQVYPQADAQKTAVCGQVSPFADDGSLFVPFVSVVTVQPHGQATEYVFDQHIGTTTTEAGRVYAAIVTNCYENGGPSAARGVPTLPPLPDTVADPHTRNAAPPPSPTAGPQADKAPSASPGTVAAPASGTVVMRQNGNLRTDPHGPPIRIISQGTSLHVFGQAPGGWYQVGEGSPEGWMHESMLDRDRR